MTPKDQLNDLIALNEALCSERRSLQRAINNRSWRAARVRAAVKRIRNAEAVISGAVVEITTLRDQDAAYEASTRLDKRIVELKRRIARLDKTNKAARVAEKIAKMQAQLRELNASLPPDFQLEDLM